MVDKLISQYVSRMTVDDVFSFASSYGFSLSKKEADLIFDTIKKDWRTIVYGNPRGILDELKISLDPFTYQKMEELYIHFKNKYQNYL